MPNLLRVFITTATLCCANAHAEFLMADSSFRQNSEGKMYCSAEVKKGDVVMGMPMAVSTAQVMFNALNGTIHFELAGEPGEYVFIADGGATFADGGCKSTRSTLDGVKVIMPAGVAESQVTFRVVHGNCGEPPSPCQIYTTDPFSLSALKFMA